MEESDEDKPSVILDYDKIGTSSAWKSFTLQSEYRIRNPSNMWLLNRPLGTGGHAINKMRSDLESDIINRTEALIEYPALMLAQRFLLD
jgi:hypothetical protein